MYSESEDVAKGKLVTGWVQMTAIVARPEIDDLKKTVTNLLFAQLPAIVNQFARPILGPIVDQMLRKLASLTDSRSTAMFAVTYHTPPEETPTVEPEPIGEAGQSIDFVIEPLEMVFPVSIAVSASSCDGESWSGGLHLSFHPDFGAAWTNFETSADVFFDFGGEDVATASVGPYSGSLDFFNGNAIPVSYVFDFTITRAVDEESGEATMSFDVVINATLGGDTASNPLVGATNIGVPIPVVEGGVVCAGEV